MLCGRDKFTQKSSHRCVGGYRKHHLVWQEITDLPDFPSGGFVTRPSFVPGESGGEYVISDNTTKRRIHKMINPTFAQGIVFTQPFDYQVTLEYHIMKDELIIDGIRYKRVEEELTLEDCLQGNYIGIPYIATKITGCTTRHFNYPTEAIAEKVLLYGLLQSVAYKLNEGKKGDWMITPVLHLSLIHI